MSADRQPVAHEPSMIEPASPRELALQRQPGVCGRLIRMIARRFPTILILTLLCVTGASVKLESMTPLYTTSAKIMIQRVTGSSAWQSSDDRQRVIRNEQELIVSTPVLASALAMPNIHDISSLRGRPDALKLIKQQLRVESGNGDDLLDISYDAADPREGTRLLAAVLDSYIRFRSGLHETTIDGSAATVLAEKRKALDTLSQKRADLQQFSAEHGLAEGNEQVDAADAVMHELGVKLAQAHVETVASQAAYDQMQHELADDPRMKQQLAQYNDNDSSLASGDPDAIAKQICTLQTQLAGYGTKFMANYAPVQLIHRKIDDLKLTRDAIIQQRWQAAVRSESELRASFVLEQAAAALSEADKQTFGQRKADVQEAEKQVAMLDRQIKDLESANKQITTMVTVIEPPAASDQPTKPRSVLILLASAVTGLLLGCCLAGVRDLKTRSQPVGKLTMLGDGLPVLARLPAVPRRQLAMNSWRDRMVDSAAEFAEACRKVHAAIELVASFSGARTVLITSTSPQEGKSTLASLLALTLAQSGKRVLLVDANLHTPVQGEIFGIEGNYGLGELLEEEIESSFVSYVHPGTDPRMDILLSGLVTTSIPDLLNSQRFTNLMAAMATEYDLVLIDSPALAVGSDARIIASACDATIVLSRETSISRKALNKTRDSITSVGGNVIGVVLNGGMSAIAPQEALVNVDISRLAPPRAPIQVSTVGFSPAVEPVQSVIAAQVRRAVDPEPQLTEPRGDDEGAHWIWAYLLGLILLLGGWMMFHGMWGTLATASIPRMNLSGHPLVTEPAISLREEPVSILMAGAGLLVVSLIAGLHARPPRQDVVLMLLSAALAVWSFHDGSSNSLSGMRQPVILFSAAQVVLLFASLMFGWMLLRRISAVGETGKTEGNSAGDIALALFAGASVMSALMILLSHWQTKGECLAVIAFSSCLSAMAAYWLASPRSSWCLWLSPLAVALFGYTCAVLNAHGIHVGMLVSLARPLPMDYVSMGPVGAVLGFWIARSTGPIAWPSQVAVE